MDFEGGGCECLAERKGETEVRRALHADHGL
jgi:hypothetical protein